MADEVDITTEREELNIANAIRAARQDSGPQPTGACHWCDEAVGLTDRWCSLECKALRRKQVRDGSESLRILG